jgi:WS/DGAT/MGAT family acyltransferase
LSPVDASFLLTESPAAHTHIAAIAVFDGPLPPHEELVSVINSRLSLLPSFRQRLHMAPLLHPWPAWINDPHFNVHYHVRHTSLPAPGSEEQLQRLVARILSNKIERDHSLWEMWFVDELENDRSAVILKAHHALLDGISLMDAALRLLDDDCDVVAASQEPAWDPAPPPTPVELLLSSLRRQRRASTAAASMLSSVVTQPRSTASAAWSSSASLASALSARVLRGAPKSLPSRPESPHRRFAFAEATLDEVNRIRQPYGATINDVVLTAVSLALGRYLRREGDRTERVKVKALVPKSLRTQADKDVLGNRIAGMIAPLPVDVTDPAQALELVRDAMGRIKRSRQSEGLSLISRVGEVIPTQVFVGTIRAASRRQAANLVISNVPGPTSGCQFMGREIESLGFVPTADRAVNVGVVSYNGQLKIGVISDYDSFDAARFGADLTHSMSQLSIAAREPLRTTRASAATESHHPPRTASSAQPT